MSDPKSEVEAARPSAPQDLLRELVTAIDDAVVIDEMISEDALPFDVPLSVLV